MDRVFLSQWDVSAQARTSGLVGTSGDQKVRGDSGELPGHPERLLFLQSFCVARNLAGTIPGTSVPRNFRDGRNFRDTELPPLGLAASGIPREDAVMKCLCVARNLPGTWAGTSVVRNFRPAPELPGFAENWLQRLDSVPTYK